MNLLSKEFSHSVFSEIMNTGVCPKSGSSDFMDRDKQLKSDKKMNSITSLLNYFSETTVNNSPGNTELENKGGNISSEVPLSHLTDIFGFESNENTTSGRKRSNTEGNMNEAKKKRPNSSDDVTLLSVTPAPALTPNYISHQFYNNVSGCSSEIPTDCNLAKESPVEHTDMPKLKEPSPISQQGVFLPQEECVFEEKRCEFTTCNYYYKTNEDYRFHNKGHVVSSSFKCTYCGLSFTGVSYLSNHERMWCTLKINSNKGLPSPLATSTPAIPYVRKDFIPKPQPQRINFPTNLSEKQVPMPPTALYEALFTKPNTMPTNKEIPVQNFHQPFIKQNGRNPPFIPPQINSNFYLPETTNRNKLLEGPNSRYFVLKNGQIQEPHTFQLPRPPMPVPIKSNVCETKPKRIYCKVESCSFSTEIERLDRDHYCEFHSGETNEICEYCSSGFPTKRILSQHRIKYCKMASNFIKKLHTDSNVDPHFLNSKKSIGRKIFLDSDKREICFYQCEFKGISELDMMNHISNYHLAEGRFPCSACELKFSSNDLLAAHEELYCSKTSEKSMSRIKGMTSDYRCPHVTCNFQTISIKIFKEHLNGHSDNFITKYLCNNCKQYFLNETTLQEHSRFPCSYKETEKYFNIVNTLVDISYENC